MEDEIYTNHCLRATAITNLSNANLDTRTIATLSGHKNHESIKSYCRDSSSAQKQEMFGILAQALPSSNPSMMASCSTANAAKQLQAQPNVTALPGPNVNNTNVSSLTLDFDERSGYKVNNMFSRCNFAGNVNVVLSPR